MPVQQSADGADDLSHCECRKNCADSKPIQMAEKDRGHAGSDGQADDIKGNLDFGKMCIRDRDFAAGKKATAYLIRSL